MGFSVMLWGAKFWFLPNTGPLTVARNSFINFYNTLIVHSISYIKKVIIIPSLIAMGMNTEDSLFLGGGGGGGVSGGEALFHPPSNNR